MTFLELAQSYVGCGFADEPERFMTLVAPGEDDATARAMAAESTCGLFIRGLLSQLITDPRVQAPYVPGAVMSDLAAMAREAGALLGDFGDVQPGDLLMLASPEHVLVVESIDNVLSSIQGGEKDAHGVQQIQRLPRSIHGGGRDTLIGGRPVELMISTAAMLGKFAPG